MSDNTLSTRVLPSFPESRYVTFKESDVYQAGHTGLLTIHHFQALREIANAVDKVRAERNRGTLEVIVIEKDWPEYQPTLELLGTRVKAELDSKFDKPPVA